MPEKTPELVEGATPQAVETTVKVDPVVTSPVAPGTLPKKDNKTLWIIITLVVVFVICPLVVCGGSFLFFGLAAKSASDSIDKATTDIKLEANKNNLNVEVQSAKDYVSTSEYATPDEGNKFVAVEVSIENKSKDTETLLGINFKVQDDKGQKYDVIYFGNKTPNLNSSDILPGKKVTGYFTFEVPKNAKLTELAYKPNIFADDFVKVKIK